MRIVDATLGYGSWLYNVCMLYGACTVAHSSIYIAQKCIILAFERVGHVGILACWHVGVNWHIGFPYAVEGAKQPRCVILCPRVCWLVPHGGLGITHHFIMSPRLRTILLCICLLAFLFHTMLICCLRTHPSIAFCMPPCSHMPLPPHSLRISCATAMLHTQLPPRSYRPSLCRMLHAAALRLLYIDSSICLMLTYMPRTPFIELFRTCHAHMLASSASHHLPCRPCSGVTLPTQSGCAVGKESSMPVGWLDG
jgi:hypothetical protein